MPKLRQSYLKLVDTTGKPIDAATVTVKIAATPPGTGTNATLFSDEDSGVGLANPVSTDSFGWASFYVADGKYDLVLLKTGIISLTLANITISNEQRIIGIHLNPKGEYGAKADGVTVDTTALQNTFNALPS